jgi:hypothetical protein
MTTRFGIVAALGAALVVVGAVCGWARAANPSVADDISAILNDGGSSGREARRRAIAALPLARMPEPQRRAVEQCLRSTTLYRRLPTETIVCERSLLEFALDKPEAIVDIWRVLGISRLALDPAGPGRWRLSDGYGTVGVLRLVHHERHDSGGLLVLHGRGGYSGPLSPRNLTGSCVLLLRHHAAEPTADGRDRQAVQVDAFVDMDGVGLEIVTRTLQPLIVRSAASNLHEICLFMTNLADAAEENPQGVVALANRLTRTAPEDRRALAAIARGAGPEDPQAPGDPTAGDRLRTELAARWLPVEELDAIGGKGY